MRTIKETPRRRGLATSVLTGFAIVLAAASAGAAGGKFGGGGSAGGGSSGGGGVSGGGHEKTGESLSDVGAGQGTNGEAEVQKKPWEIYAVWETHRMIRQ